MDLDLPSFLIGAGAAIIGGIIGGWVQSWTWYRFELRRATDERRRRWTEIALEWSTTGRRDSLRRADLRDADLREIDLGPGEGEDKGADLSYADLRKADLSWATLSRVDLRGADLRWAWLQHYKLQRAMLQDAKLQGARLWGANLEGADLSSADLRGADLIDGRGVSMWTKFRVATRGIKMLKEFLAETEKLRQVHILANLGKANLQWAKLQGAKVTPEQLERAANLEGAIMTDGTRHK